MRFLVLRPSLQASPSLFDSLNPESKAATHYREAYPTAAQASTEWFEAAPHRFHSVATDFKALLLKSKARVPFFDFPV